MSRHHLRQKPLPDAALEVWLRRSLSQQFDQASDTPPSRDLSRLLDRLGLVETSER